MNNIKRSIPVLLLVVAMMVSTISVFGASNPNINIISPNQKTKIEGNSFLISVKVTAPTKIGVEVYEQKGDKMVLHEPVKYMTTDNKLSYFTKRVSGVNHGYYCVMVRSYNAKGKAVYQDKIVFEVKEKNEVKAFNDKAVTSGVLHNLLKTILD